MHFLHVPSLPCDLSLVSHLLDDEGHANEARRIEHAVEPGRGLDLTVLWPHTASCAMIGVVIYRGQNVRSSSLTSAKSWWYTGSGYAN